MRYPAIKKPRKKPPTTGEGGLTGPAHPPPPPTSVNDQPGMPAGLNHKL